MPYIIRKVSNKRCYSVSKREKKGKRVLAKCTTLKKAKKQVRLLSAIEHNPTFVPRNKTRRIRRR